MMMILLTMNMMFFFLNHPMSMGVILIIQTLMVSIYSGMLMKTFWMSYMLTISMLSGMLVLFIYMSSIASNQKFKNSTKMWLYFTSMMLAMISFLFLLKKMIIKNNYLGMGMSILKMEEMYFLNKLFMNNNLYITIMLVVYLLLTMIVSSFLVNISEGPMRLKI
uniref:NADH dehydrogenase subunit 6 n=1 Tax=Tuxedo cruralis TaxID=1336461 RepID=A0A514LPU8_9HEMI|nr:NADH dehydrogenase subunit 6 [Tuxedo cruralis]QDI93839.1 NADH dehydrogenase subunit 6 [Tuxedo cruralis]